MDKLSDLSKHLINKLTPSTSPKKEIISLLEAKMDNLEFGIMIQALANLKVKDILVLSSRLRFLLIKGQSFLSDLKEQYSSGMCLKEFVKPKPKKLP